MNKSTKARQEREEALREQDTKGPRGNADREIETNAVVLRREPDAPRRTFADTPAMTVAQAVERYNALREFVSGLMREDIDYGKIPGTGDKPVLLKPGAEKLCTFFGLRAEFLEVRNIEDFERGLFFYVYKCRLLRGDGIIGEGDGSCNSHEKKYRYRQSSRICPACGKPAITKGKAQWGGGWICWTKKDGCGEQFADGDPAIESQEAGQVENPDPAENINTIQKMAQKRALVAATLVAVNASEFFTQDLEDMTDDSPATKGNGARGMYGQPAAKSNGRPATNGKATPQTTPAPASDRAAAAAAGAPAWTHDRNVRCVVPVINTKDAHGDNPRWGLLLREKRGDQPALWGNAFSETIGKTLVLAARVLAPLWVKIDVRNKGDKTYYNIVEAWYDDPARQPEPERASVPAGQDDLPF